MPVTVKLASHGASKAVYEDAHSLSDTAGTKEIHEYEKELQLFFLYAHSKNSNILASANGFVHVAIDAHSRNDHLSIRPEDVWFAILSQLNIWINANADEARDKFFAPEGKENLIVTILNDIDDCEKLAGDMAREIEKNVIDPELREWIMPTFTTTIATDAVVASTLVMGTVQRHFKINYRGLGGCSLPSVTLLGEQSDWVKLYKKLDKLETFGVKPAQFGDLLVPIISRFIESFQDHRNEEIVEFWSHMVSVLSHGSGDGGSMDCEGWISAFCFWSEQGENMNDRQIQFHGGRGFTLDRVIYHTIDARQIPPGYASLPAKFCRRDGKEIDTVIIAGSLGTQYSRSDEASGGSAGTFPFYGFLSEKKALNAGFDSVSPLSDWWMFNADRTGEASATSQRREADEAEPAQSAPCPKSAERGSVTTTSSPKTESLINRLTTLFSRTDIKK